MPPSNPALISPYPGGKSGEPYEFKAVDGRWLSRVCDRPHYYDSLLLPFAGSGATAHQHSTGISNVIASDIDPGVQAVWECWHKEELRRPTENLIVWWKKRILDNPKAGFAQLKDVHDKRFFRMNPAAISAAYLTIKRLLFGGVLRCNQQGKLNVALSADKLNKFLRSGKKHKRQCQFTYPLFPSSDKDGTTYWGWKYQWPDNGIENLTFRHSWQDAVKALADSDYSNALVVIDPPYYSPQEWVEERANGDKRKSKMTTAYRGHNPQSADELARCVDCLNAVLATGKAGRVVVFNYWSDELANAITDMDWKYRYRENASMFVSQLGYLGGMNNAQKFHGRDVEAVWEIGGKRMFQDYDAIEQGSLLETSRSLGKWWETYVSEP